MNLKIILFLLTISVIFSGCSTIIPSPNPLTLNGDAIITLEEGHYHNHRGVSYLFSKEFNLNAGGSEINLLCPSTQKSMHITKFVLNVDSAPVHLHVYRNVTYNISTGTNITPLNTNLNFPNNSTIHIINNPSMVSYNPITIIHASILGGNNRVSSDFGTIGEFILAPNECYNLNITNNNGNGVYLEFNLYWYEEE